MMIRRYLRFAFGSLFAAITACAALVVFPGLLFAHSISSGRLVISATQPIPPEGGSLLLKTRERLLERSPVALSARLYTIYVTGSGWRERLFFALSPQAGGVAYYLPGNHVFLSGADFETGRLIKKVHVIEPPRTLAYYCAHEMTHLALGEHVGLLGLFRLPQWVVEGLPDYVGIEKRQSFDELDRLLGDRPVDLDMMRAFGVYPRYRLLVTYFLEKKGWSLEKLLATRLSFDDATKLMRSDGG